MKEFLPGEMDRLADLQTEALHEAAADCPTCAEATIAEAEKVVANIETVVEEMTKDDKEGGS